MSKLTPLILAVIMMASTSLVALDWAELEDKNIVEADGRTGPDASATDILSPRATTTDPVTGEKLHTLRAGEDVHFEMYIENVGDTAIDEMGITLSVYLSEGGVRGNVALDAAGNELSWINGDVVCDDVNVCPWSTLAANELLDYGRYTMTYQGSTVAWTPETGDYIIVVETTAIGDADPGNDVREIPVSVVDWTDVIVDLAWDSGKEIEGGSGDKAFTLTVTTGGSSAWSARDVTLELDIQGTLVSALDSNGQDILGKTTVGGLGTNTITEVFRHAEDENNVTNGSRYVIDFEDEYQYFGVVSPDTSGESGAYSIEVNLMSYTLYGQLPDCEETVDDRSDENATSITYIHFCEVSQGQDDVASTSEDMIEGNVQTFHDIGITGLVINQGYAIDENGDAIGQPSMPGMTDGPLNPAMSSIQASVRHMGSDIGVTYDWKVAFTVENTITGSTMTQDADNCTFGFGEVYEHRLLGDDFGQGTAFEMGEACMMYDFSPGIYNISATVSMVGGTNADMSARNNNAAMYGISALNNRPSVSLTVEQDVNTIVAGPDGMITLVADAFDADDDAGLSLAYEWTHPGMETQLNSTILIPSDCNGVGPQFSTCNLIALTSEWAGVNTYTVRVSDEYGSYAQDFTNIFVWNQIIVTAETDSGIGLTYDLTYDGSSFGIDTWSDSAASYTKDLTDFGYAGEYNSVAVIDYSPSTTYMAEDVYAQSVTMTYDASTLAPTSVFWISNGNWAQLDATITTTATDGSIDVDLTSLGQVMPQGEIVLMGGELQVIEKPDARVVDLVAIASSGGTITASWGYEGTTVPGIDYLQMEICPSNGDCTSENVNISQVAHSLDGQTQTEHGVTYTYTLKVCNVADCQDGNATASATADSQVDGDATATQMTVANAASGNSWTVSWTVSGDASDVEGWKVCWQRGTWMAGDAMPSTCTDAGTASSVDISNSGQPSGSYYFAAIPYDDKGNEGYSLPGTDIQHSGAVVDDPCEDASYKSANPDECSTVGTSDESSDGEVPTWTWGVIIGLVVIAFVVGAFILSRGGDGDEGKNWDY